MNKRNKIEQLCYLCGTNIRKDKLSYDHIPPKAFYPKRARAGLNLQVAPAHKTCNENYREDEEYFQHVFLLEVLNRKPPITELLKDDFFRKAQRPQTPALIRNILKGVSSITPGGIYLPHGRLQVEIDQLRIERVVLKVACGLFHIENHGFMPLKNAKDIRFCLDEDEVPELYRLYWPHAELKGVYPDVFSHKYFRFENLHLYSLLFWKAFMYCVAFEDPNEPAPVTAKDNYSL